MSCKKIKTLKGGCFVDKNIYPTKSSADNAIRFDSALSTCVATPAKLSFDVEWKKFNKKKHIYHIDTLPRTML